MRGEPSSSRSLVTAAPAKRPDDQAVSVVQHLEPALAPFVLQRARQCRAAMLQQHHAALSLSASTAYILAACGARGLAAGPSIEVLANPTNGKARTNNRVRAPRSGIIYSRQVGECAGRARTFALRAAEKVARVHFRRVTVLHVGAD